MRSYKKFHINPKFVDISHYDNVHPGGFTLFRNAGYIAVIGKVTESITMVDHTFALRRQAAKDAGLGYGAYHFIRPGNIAKQANIFVEQAKPDDKLCIALDHEDRRVSLEQAEEFVTIVHDKVGRWPKLYSGSVIKEQLVDRPSVFWSNIDLWLSHYSGHPTWPNAWKAPWAVQFTGDGSGPLPHTVPGITIEGGMDINSINTPEGLPLSDSEFLKTWV